MLTDLRQRGSFQVTEHHSYNCSICGRDSSGVAAGNVHSLAISEGQQTPYLRNFGGLSMETGVYLAAIIVLCLVLALAGLIFCLTHPASLIGSEGFTCGKMIWVRCSGVDI